MASRNVEVVRGMLEAYARGGADGVIDFIHPDFHGEVPPEVSAEPDSYDGHDGVRRYFDSFYEIVDDLRFDAEELVELGPDVVAARGLITGQGRESGIPIEMRVPMLMRLRDGKLTGMVGYRDWDEAVAAASAPD